VLIRAKLRPHEEHYWSLWSLHEERKMNALRGCRVCLSIRMFHLWNYAMRSNKAQFWNTPLS